MAKLKTVSEKLGLERLTHKTAANCAERARVIEKMLEKNKVPRSLVESAKRMAAIYRLESKKRSGQPTGKAGKPIFPKEIKESPKVIKAAVEVMKKNKQKKAAEFDLKQGILPHFLEQLSVPRVEEIVAKLVFDALRKGLEAQQAERNERKLKAV